MDGLRSTHVALKVIPKRDPTNITGSVNTVPNAITEQAIHRKLTEKKQAHFLPLVASWHDSENFYLATVSAYFHVSLSFTYISKEYLRGGDMSVELMRCRTFEEERARFYAAELVCPTSS